MNRVTGLHLLLARSGDITAKFQGNVAPRVQLPHASFELNSYFVIPEFIVYLEAFVAKPLVSPTTVIYVASLLTVGPLYTLDKL